MYKIYLPLNDLLDIYNQMFKFIAAHMYVNRYVLTCSWLAFLDDASKSQSNVIYILNILSIQIYLSYNLPISVDEQSVLKRLSALTLNGATDGNSCSCCGIGPFESRQQQIAHYKHHWHTHNLKRKLFGKTTLTLGQFNSRVGKGSHTLFLLYQ